MMPELAYSVPLPLRATLLSYLGAFTLHQPRRLCLEFSSNRISRQGFKTAFVRPFLVIDPLLLWASVTSGVWM